MRSARKTTKPSESGTFTTIYLETPLLTIKSNTLKLIRYPRHRRELIPDSPFPLLNQIWNAKFDRNSVPPEYGRCGGG